MSYQRGDHYTRKAQAKGFAARSVFKLEEIQKRHKLMRSGDRVVDLGCFPGSWTRYARQQIRQGTLVGVDLKAPESVDATFLAASVFDVTAEQLLEVLGGPADVLLSDMAPATTGDKFSDHVRQIELAEQALMLAQAVVKPGGHFVVKVFDGEDAPAYTKRVRAAFKQVKRVKPAATRSRSVEFFLVGLGRR